MTGKEAIKEAVDIYEFILSDEVKKYPEKMHVIISIANLLLSQKTKKSPKPQKVKA
jgi:hypothetical protein